MIIGACRVKLILYDSNSLKDKRRVVKSIIERLKSRYNISIAEVDLNESWKTTIIGFVCVTNDTKHANQMISNVVKFIEEDNRVEIVEEEKEIL